jgi:hypothetical protein
MSKRARQYTLRNVPERVDRTLRQRARESGLSFNQVALDALTIGAGETSRPKRDLSEVVGSLSGKEAARMDDEIQLQRQIDPGLWK